MENLQFDSQVLHFGWNDFIRNKYGVPLSYKLFVPETYRPDGKTPLMLYLHGDGSNRQTTDFVLEQSGEATTVHRAIAEHRNAVIIVPVATESWLGLPNDKTRAYPYLNFDMREAAPTKELLTAVGLVKEITVELQTDANRIYLSGYSRGTIASWWILNNYSELFAAAILCCGAGDSSVAKNLKDVPVWLFHGNKDVNIPISESRTIAEALQAAGGTVRFTECEGYAHGLEEFLCKQEGLTDWLFSFCKN